MVTFVGWNWKINSVSRDRTIENGSLVGEKLHKSLCDPTENAGKGAIHFCNIVFLILH